MVDKVLKLKRNGRIYSNKENALNSLNAYVTANLDSLHDGEPIIGRYYEDNECKVLVGIVHSFENMKGVNWINLDEGGGQTLSPADSSVEIADDQIRVNLKQGEDNVLKLDDDGVYVSLREILDAVPATDLSEIEDKLSKIQEVSFGGEISGDTTAGELYPEDDRLSASTSLVDADKILSKAIDDNSLVIAAAANDLNDRIDETNDKFQLVFGKSAAETATAEELYVEDVNLSGATSMAEADRMLSKVVDENAFVTSAALNNLNDRTNTVSGKVTSIESRLEGVDTNLAALNSKIENLDAIDVDDTLNKTSAMTIDGKVVYTIGVKIDDALDLDSPLPVANSAVSTTIKENEEVVAAALNDLNTRLIELSGNSHDERVDEVIEQVEDIENTVNDLSSGLTDVRNDLSELAENTADAIDEISSGLTDVESGLTEITYRVEILEDNVDRLNDEVSGLTSGITEITQIIEDNELVIASAFNDINDRLLVVEENAVTGITSTQLNVERTGGSVNIDFNDVIDLGTYGEDE